MVQNIANVIVLLIAVLHVGILIIEMFFWDKPLGMKAFGLGVSREFAEKTKFMAANQGLYNGFIAAGLFWGLFLGAEGLQFKVFFLLCVLIAGIYGAVTVKGRIIFIQTVPAAAGLLMIYLA